MKLTKKAKRTAVLTGLAVLAAMAVIFVFSSFGGEASGAQSGFFSRLIAETFVKGFKESGEAEQAATLERVSFFVRKAAHFTEFAVLGAALFSHVSLADRARKGRLRVWRAILVSIPVAVLYAASDEVHQLFVAGRAGTFTDVLIDSAGAVFGIAAAAALLAVAFVPQSGRRGKVRGKG